MSRRDRPFAGLRCELTLLPDGSLLSGGDGASYEHDWQVRCTAAVRDDDPTKTEWRATVRPGLVRGFEPTIGMSRRRGDAEIQVPITEDPRPYLVLDAWRNPLLPSGLNVTARGDLIAIAGEGYPAFFDRFGIRAPAKGGKVSLVGATSGEPDDFRTREIRAADIALIVPRLATRSDVTVLSPALDAASITIATAFSNDYVRNAPSPFRIIRVPLWRPPLEPTMLERLEGTAVEPQTDELKIATVWMVSPPKADPEAEPDHTWSAFAQHFLFWNVMHASRRHPPTAPPPPLQFVSGLALGVADSIFAGLLSPSNDAFAKIAAYFGAANYKGEFWTV